VNVDAIACGISPFNPESVQILSGRFMHGRLRELAEQGSSFANETTLASRTFAPWLKRISNTGYQTHLIFLGLPDPDTALARVALRVSLGGHNIPKPDVIRKYYVGLGNLFNLYIPYNIVLANL
jgi:predicted ABC-type ATPase